MGKSSDGIICYGLAFPDEHEFPWSEDGDIDSWWRDVCGFINPVDDPFDEEGRYKPGCGRAESSLYFDASRQWDKSNPLPVEEVICYSWDANSIVLAVPGTVITSGCGEAREFNPKDLVDMLYVQDICRFIRFIEKYELTEHRTLKWLLTSFYG